MNIHLPTKGSKAHSNNNTKDKKYTQMIPL